jgi:prepilin-type processing-associated H-X9-DG protein
MSAIAGGSPSPKKAARVLPAIVLVVLACGALLVYVLRQGFEALARTGCRHDLVQIGLICRVYAEEHGGHLPSTWADLNLVGEKTNWARLLRCPSTGHEVGIWSRVDLWADYRLLPGRSTNDPPDRILAIEPLANHKSTGANVLFVDGSSQWWPASRVLEEEKTLR